nr:hypothetical protein [Ilumatobacter fluminis]
MIDDGDLLVVGEPVRALAGGYDIDLANPPTVHPDGPERILELVARPVASRIERGIAPLTSALSSSPTKGSTPFGVGTVDPRIDEIDGLVEATQVRCDGEGHKPGKLATVQLFGCSSAAFVETLVATCSDQLVVAGGSERPEGHDDP